MSKLNKLFKIFKEKTSAQGNNTTKKEQYRNLAIALLGVVGIAVLVVLIKHHHSNQPAVGESASGSKGETVNFSNPLNHVNQQSVWIQRAENKLSQQHRVEQSLAQGQQTANTQLEQQKNTVEVQQKEIEALTQQLSNIKNELAQQKQVRVDASQTGRMIQPARQGGEAQTNYYRGPQMQDISLNLTPRKRRVKKLRKTPSTYVSSGSYITAVVLQGVDAAAGVTSQSDPRPVLLRTITNGTLPGNYHSHLKNCHIVGSGYGDASSERVYVRLETMSCTRHGIEYDYPVYGYVSGTDAKTGQHGPVVFRDGPFVKRAFWGGFFSGLGNIGQQYSQNYSTSPLGSVATINPSKIPLAAASGGVGNAAQMYAQYNIRRAEQYQPVVEFSAGNVVNIVFTKGFWLDGHTSKGQGNGGSYAQAQASQTLSNQMNQLAQH